LEAVQRDVGRARAFQSRHSRRVSVQVLEIKLPAFVQTDWEPLSEATMGALPVIQGDFQSGVTPFFEVPPGPGWRDALENDLMLLCLDRAMSLQWQRLTHRRSGIKIRCGGIQASSVPPSDQV